MLVKLPQQYTGFENYLDEELVKIALTGDDLLKVEIAQRLEDYSSQIDEFEEDDVRGTIEEFEQHFIGDRASTLQILEELTDEHEVKNYDHFADFIEERRSALSLVDEFDMRLLTSREETFRVLEALGELGIDSVEALTARLQPQNGDKDMSLEQALNDNTAAVRELIATLKGTAPTPAADVPAEKPQPKAEKAKPAAKAETPKAETPKADAPVPAVVDRKVVTDKLVKVAKLFGRETALGYLKPYGATNLSGVPDDKLAEIEARFDEKLAEKAAA